MCIRDSYFTPLPGCFSPFPHGTSSLSVAKEYLALRGGPRGFRPGFSCPAVLRNLQGRPYVFAYGTITLCGANFHSLRLTHDFVTSRPAGRRIKQALQPSRNNGCRLSRYGSLGSSLFARHYSGSRGFFPFLELLRCFSSLAYRCLPYFIQARARAHYHA